MLILISATFPTNENGDKRRKHRKAMAERDVNYANRLAGIEIEKSETELFRISCPLHNVTKI